MVTCTDRDDVAATVALQLRTTISRLQAGTDRIVQVCLTGGRIANEVYQQLAGVSEDDTVEWGRVEFWWGDERFVPVESPERNAGQSLALLAATIPFDPALVHPMPARGSAEADLRHAALHYASELGETTFDICLLGMGEDGHVASIFPDHPSFEKETASTVIGVTNSPKPPAERLSLTLPSLNRSAEIWLIVAGSEKADAVARAVAGDPGLPAGSVRGTERTVWFLDAAAAPPAG